MTAYKGKTAEMQEEAEKKISKAIPITGRGGLYACETSRIPHFTDNLHIEGG
jgi:hypothetical protein